MASRSVLMGLLEPLPPPCLRRVPQGCAEQRARGGGAWVGAPEMAKHRLKVADSSVPADLRGLGLLQPQSASTVAAVGFSSEQGPGAASLLDSRRAAGGSFLPWLSGACKCLAHCSPRRWAALQGRGHWEWGRGARHVQDPLHGSDRTWRSSASAGEWASVPRAWHTAPPMEQA